MPDEITEAKAPAKRLLIKGSRGTLPLVKDKYPFIDLERGHLEIDDTSMKWIDSDANVIRAHCHA